jgi:site-specific DNA recombinase
LRARTATEGDEVVAEFIDDGCSGARLDRPGLDALRDAAEAGTLDAIWCLSPDRLARSYAYQILILDELARYDVPVRFADAPPLDDPQGRLLVQIQGVIAEHERAKFAERGRRGKLYRARSGEVLATKVPYGYRRARRGAGASAHLVINEAEAAVVRRVFTDFLAGHSLRHLAITLSAEGIPSPEGKPVWRISTICRLLRNEAYVGRLYWNRAQTRYDATLGRDRLTTRPREEWVEIPIPTIIDEGTFDAAAATARDNSGYSPRRTEPDTFLLRRLLRCDACGVKLFCHRARRGEATTRYYMCPHRDPWRAGGADRRCHEGRVRADELDSFVFDQVRQLLSRPEVLAAGESALERQSPAPDDKLLADQLARLERRIHGAHNERGRVADLYQAGVIDNTEMARRSREIDTRSRRFDQERQALIARQTELATGDRLQHCIANFAQRAMAGIGTLDFSGRQQLLRLVLEDVRVRGWHVELRLRIPLDDDNPPAGVTTSTSVAGRRARPRSSKGAPSAKEAVSRNNGLRSIGERPQESPQGGRGHDPVPEHPAARPCAQALGVAYVAGPGDHGVHKGQYFASRLETPGTVGKTNSDVDERLQAEACHQCRHQDQPGVGHQPRLVEGHLHTVESMRYWLHWKCLLATRRLGLKTSQSSQVRRPFTRMGAP